MTEYVKFDMVMMAVIKEIHGLNNLEQLKLWIADNKFVDHIRSELYDHDLIGTEEDLINEKMKILDDLIEALTKFEQEFKDLQVNKFKQLELLRLASEYVSRSKGTVAGYVHEDIVTETRECGHPPCGKVFIADPPTKMYCSEKCREKAKKWRKRHGDEQ